VSPGSTPHLETPAGPAPIATGDLDRLQESFRVFSERTAHLEKAYERLTRRAARVDLELRQANLELAAKVEELGALSESRRRMVAALPEGIVVVDAGGVISNVNPAAARILGRPAAELEGRLRAAIVGPTGDELLSDDDLAPGSEDVEREIVALDGSRRRVAMTLVELGDGCTMRVIADRTVVTRLREQVGRLDTLASLGEMAAGIAHEIRNPLNGIDGFAALLQRRLVDSEDEDLTRYASRVRSGVRELDGIVVNLLAFARPEQLQLEEVDLRPLLSELAEDARSYGDGFEPEILLSFPGGRRGTLVHADALKLRMIVRNLLKNAVEAMSEAATLRLILDGDDDAWTIAVEDEGAGVPEDFRERLFRPFCTTKARGTGLGLAIAQKLANLHGGGLSYEPREPGSRFALRISRHLENRDS
jgi:PAS domain S-box-containing protein